MLALSYLIDQNLVKSEEKFNECLKIANIEYGNINQTATIILEKLYSINIQNKKYDKALEYLNELILIHKNLFGTNNVKYTDYLYKKSMLYDDLNNFSMSEKTLFDLSQVLKETKGVNSIEYQLNLRYIATFYKKNKKIDLAQKKYLESHRLQKLNLSDLLIDEYIFTLKTIAIFYLEQFDFDKSKAFYIEAQELVLKTYTIYSKEYLKVCYELARLYSLQKKYTESEKLFLSIIDIARKNISLKDEEHEAILELGEIYSTTNDFKKAEYYYKKTIEISSNITYNINANKGLHHIYLSQDDFKNAEKYLINSISLCKKKFGNESRESLDLLLKSTFFYSSIGDEKKMYQYLNEATSIFNNNDILSSDKHLMIIFSMRWSNIYLSNKEFNKAINALNKVIELSEENPTYNYNSNFCASIYCSIAHIYFYKNDLKNSLLHYEKALKNRNKNIIDDLEFNIYFGLLEVYSSSNDISNYTTTLNSVVNLIKVMESKHFISYRTYYNFLKLLSNNNHYDSLFLEYYKKFDYKRKQNIFNILDILSEHQLLNSVNKSYSNLLNFELSTLTKNNYNIVTDFNSYTYNYNLLLKNLTLRNQKRIKKDIEVNGVPEIKIKYNNLIEYKKQLNKLEEQSTIKSEAYLSLLASTESLEKDLVRSSSTFAKPQNELTTSRKQIQEKLKPNEVVIDLVSFNYYNKKWTDSIMYGAFVIKKDSKFPKFVNLFEEKQLAVLLERNNKAHDSIQSKIINKQYSDKEISNLFYKPLEAELKNSNTIYLAPSGLAHQINFKALPVNTNQTLGEKYKLILLGSTTTLVDYKPLTINKKIILRLFYMVELITTKNSLRFIKKLIQTN
ncbi:tetratricopeptide repeat protein [Flavobacterium davisii]|uniref:Tetratricopeptide repeat protein n=1 Tax=Flavobacterium columnare TaxID=996 RepID=A0A8G0PAL9_9FLAO|nr:tetratricopeptide repeat protein [Flavobacterium davisii]QYS89628.1 tetratricopeptide repeat protein [Flavobacterium davisii]